ncbi:CCA tRNA nucleotidyltransferase [Sphingomonas turrisvirgatae]|uniref:Polynucleotide adenylyltransferase n=1 Tax=Sphingomonas turrisvirgatae TaxID=1888892 RepID=A0A1E3LTG8_9SPHN|nr:CCA tRNA nucleotidyltransferase [Sphingomonas turrisvirgatae]ODP37058.1 polynucleotide adenylyltransferase [Sphingomonas turrisvirgatae]
MILPQAEWQRRPGLDRLTSTLGAGQARYVGGAVRDTLLGLPVTDLDIATTLPPERVVALLEAAGIKAIPTGIAHGTITAVANGTVVEVTTLRRDLATDGRHARVAFTDDWRADAARRDFTINALYADPITREVTDYFGGLADLEARRIRFIGDPLQRIAEDHLRILRFFRFLARFGDTPDPDGLAACVARANDLMALSRERIRDELVKLLVATDAVRVMALMIDHDVLKPVLPEIDVAAVERLRRLADDEAVADIAPDAIRRLAALLPREPAANDAIGARLRLSKAERQALASAIGDDLAENARALAYRITPERAVDRLLLAGQPAAAASIMGWSPPVLSITGGNLIERGLRKGPEVARALHAVRDRWVAEGFPDEPRTGEIADAVVAQLLRSASNA